MFRYGFRVNPLEWIVVITGYNEGNNSHYPSVALIMCKYFVSRKSMNIYSEVTSFHLLFFCFSVSVVPVVLSLLIEKCIAVVCNYL